jgi:hypothetical protein
MTVKKAREKTESLQELFGDLELEADNELQAEAAAQLSPKEREMAEVAQELLRMERDMLLPGSEQGVTERVKRIGDLIESREF